MAGNKEDSFSLVILGVFILGVSFFWHYKTDNPFLYSKELFAKAGILILLGTTLYRYNRYLTCLVFYAFITSFIKLSSRNLWALGNLRDFLLYYLLLRIILERISSKEILRIFLAAFFLQFIVSILQYFNIDILGRTSFLDTGTYWKIAGTFGNTHILAIWLGLTAPLALLIRNKKISWLIISITILWLLLIKRHGGLSILLFILTIWKILEQRKYYPFITGIIILSFFGVILCANHARLIRSEIFKNVISSIIKHPLIGYGLNSFSGLGITAAKAKELQAHNEFLQAYCELGIFALLIIPFIFKYIKNASLIAKTNTGRIAVAQFFGITYTALFSFPLHIAPMAILFLTNLAICDTYIQRRLLNENTLFR